MNIKEIQKELKRLNIDAWLFYDFHGRDYIASRILKLNPNKLASRRWFYLIPANGEPIKLNHKIEPNYLDHLDGSKYIYLTWEELNKNLTKLLKNIKTVAMQYSPNNAIPYVSIVDAGTIELIRSFNVEVVSSGELVSIFESSLTQDEIENHKKCGEIMLKIKDMAFRYIRERIDSGNNPTEYEVQKYMHSLFIENNLFWDHGPIVGINENAADPHFEPTEKNSQIIREGDLVLIDLFARFNEHGSIWFDVTWMGYVGQTIPDNIVNIFNIIRDARDAGFNLVKESFQNNNDVTGADVDNATRNVIDNAGYGEYFWHRTGHNISTELHGNGTHMDNHETKDNRKILKGTIFSIEPGIYIPDEKIGFRTEIDVIVNNDGSVDVFGEMQSEIINI